MPKREVNILHANGTVFILEGTVGKDYRFSIPTQLRSRIQPKAKMKITIEIIGEN